MVDAFDYAHSQDTAERLITKFGQAVSVRRLVNSGSEWEPTQTPSDTATYGARIEFTTRHYAKWSILATDQRWLVAAGPLATLVPVPGDRIVVGSADYEIVRADPLNPAGTAVMYDVQVRA